MIPTLKRILSRWAQSYPGVNLWITVFCLVLIGGMWAFTIERIGYPRGLKGDSILLGARILAVADTIEAMSSHRPYRAGLGIEMALDEVTKNRAKIYDATAVDACVKLFREKRFSFPV